MCKLGSLLMFLLSSANFFKVFLFIIYSLINITGVSNGLDPDLHQHFYDSGFGLNCLQRLSVDAFYNLCPRLLCFYNEMNQFCRGKRLSLVYILGILSEVKGTKFDLRNMTWLGKRIPEVPGNYGFDHNFCIGETGWMKHAAR